MTRILGMALALIIVAATFAGEPSIELIRSTIDGGGIMRSTGGNFELSGTIGQPDAGVLTGGDLQLTGGFWFELTPADCNEDGSADLVDHAAFTECLLGPDGGVLSGCECFDVDTSESVDLRDFAVAQTLLVSP